MLALLNGLKPAIKGPVLARNPQTFTEAVDHARLAELSVIVSASSTEQMITEQLTQMRHDIQQLAGRGMVNEPSITTLSTEGATRSPSPSTRRVRFNEPEARAAQQQNGPSRPLRSAAGNNSMFTPSFRRDQQARTNERYNGRNNRLLPAPQAMRNDALCTKCGRRQHENAFRCPAIGKQCWICSRFNHLSTVCPAGGRMRE